jgi:hypothetical protein
MLRINELCVSFFLSTTSRHILHCTKALLIVRNEIIFYKLPGSVGMKVVTHIVTLHLHIITELVEGGSGDHVALTIDLPSDRRVRTAELVGYTTSSG